MFLSELTPFRWCFQNHSQLNKHFENQTGKGKLISKAVENEGEERVREREKRRWGVVESGGIFPSFHGLLGGYKGESGFCCPFN